MKAHLSPFRVSAGVARFYLLHSSARGRTLRTRERTLPPDLARRRFNVRHEKE